MEILTASPSRAVVVLAHGLNQRVSALQSLGEGLHARGATVVPVHLRGHRVDVEPSTDTIEAWRSLTWQDWVEDWEHATQDALAIAERDGVPLTFVGFSLGALVHVFAMATRTHERIPYARQVLLAPAVRVRSLTRAVRILRAMGGRFLVPAFTPQTIRSHDVTSVASFEALFYLESALGTLDDASSLHIPTLVLIDRRDELASEVRLRDWIAQHALTDTWHIEGIPRVPGEKRSPYRHYVSDATGLGERSFAQLLDRMGDFLITSR